MRVGQTDVGHHVLDGFALHGVDEVDLGQHDHHLNVVVVKAVLDLPDRGAQTTEEFVSIVAGVGHEQEEVAFQRLGQGGTKSLEGLAREGINEPDGVGEQHTRACFHAADGGLKGGEQPVFDEHGFPGQGAKEARFSCVRVPCKSNGSGAASRALTASFRLSTCMTLEALPKPFDLPAEGHQDFGGARCTRTTVPCALTGRLLGNQFAEHGSVRAKPGDAHLCSCFD